MTYEGTKFFDLTIGSNCLDKCLDETKTLYIRDHDQGSNPQDQDSENNTVSRLSRDETVSRDFPSLVKLHRIGYVGPGLILAKALTL